VSNAPVELIALDEPYEGVISARREGEPTFTHVQDVADAIMAALSRGVYVVVPAAMFEQIRGDVPPDLPPYIKVR
jgi:nucleoside-diphosphate-sugar epimerase